MIAILSRVTSIWYQSFWFQSLSKKISSPFLSLPNPRSTSNPKYRSISKKRGRKKIEKRKRKKGKGKKERNKKNYHVHLQPADVSGLQKPSRAAGSTPSRPRVADVSGLFSFLQTVPSPEPISRPFGLCFEFCLKYWVHD